MDCAEERVDTRKHTPEALELAKKNTELLYRFNQAMPGSEEAQKG